MSPSPATPVPASLRYRESHLSLHNECSGYRECLSAGFYRESSSPLPSPAPTNPNHPPHPVLSPLCWWPREWLPWVSFRPTERPRLPNASPNRKLCHENRALRYRLRALNPPLTL